MHVVMVSSGSPEKCGIASYSADLIEAFATESKEFLFSWIVVGKITPEGQKSSMVLGSLDGPTGTALQARTAAKAVSRASADVVWLQHEYGLYGRWRIPYKDTLGPFLERLELPLVTTLHTVLSQPPTGVAAALRRLSARSAVVTVMCSDAAKLLTNVYKVPSEKIAIIPHGVRLIERPEPVTDQIRRRSDPGPVIVSFGFLSPTKGIENAISAMPYILAEWPNAMYVVAGQSHPLLGRTASVGYRRQLADLAKQMQVAPSVKFVNRFIANPDLDLLLSRCDFVISPYLDMDQSSSGTLARAVGSGCVVVSSVNGHSRDLASFGAVHLLESTSPVEIARAIISLLAEPRRMDELRRRSEEYSRRNSWWAVSRRAAGILTESRVELIDRDPDAPAC